MNLPAATLHLLPAPGAWLPPQPGFLVPRVLQGWGRTCCRSSRDFGERRLLWEYLAGLRGQSWPWLLMCPFPQQGDSPDSDCVGDPGLPGAPGIPGERGEQVGALPIHSPPAAPHHSGPSQQPWGPWLVPRCPSVAGPRPPALVTPNVPISPQGSPGLRGPPGPPGPIVSTPARGGGLLCRH